MNDTSVHTILAAISEAKLALDREPEYKARIAELETNLSQSQSHAQQLELKAIDRANEVSDLLSKVRSLEVERDDASFRNLELEDKVAGYAKLVNDFTLNIESLRYDFQRDLEALGPKKAEVKEQSNPSIVAPTTMEQSANSASNIEMAAVGTSTNLDSGQVASSAPQVASASDTSTELPYKGKRYSEVVQQNGGHYIALEDWTSGGGTYDDYWL